MEVNLYTGEVVTPIDDASFGYHGVRIEFHVFCDDPKYGWYAGLVIGEFRGRMLFTVDGKEYRLNVCAFSERPDARFNGAKLICDEEQDMWYAELGHFHEDKLIARRQAAIAVIDMFYSDKLTEARHGMAKSQIQ